MENIFDYGGVIGNNLTIDVTDSDINPNTRYIIGTTPGFGNPNYVGGRTQSGSGTTLNFTISLTSLTGGTNSSPQEGDMVIVAIELSGTTNKSYRISGFTQIVDLYNNRTFDSNLQVGYKFMGSTPDSSVTITGGTGSTADAYAAVVHVWRLIDSTTPLDVSVTTASGSGFIPNPPAITPVSSNSVIVVCAGASHDEGTRTFGASYLSNFRTTGAAGAIDATIGIGSIFWTGGTYDPPSWTFSSNENNTLFSTNSVTMALRPATVDYPVYGNLKNSGIWSMPTIYNYQMRPSVEFITSANSVSDLSTYTFTSTNIGSEEVNRFIVVGVSAMSASSGRNINSVTVDGISATKIAEGIWSSTLSGTGITSLYIVEVPTNTNVDIVATFSGSMSRCFVSVYKVLRINSTTPQSTVTLGESLSASSYNLSVNGSSRGVIISQVMVNSGTSNFTWTGSGLNENIDVNIESAMTVSSASRYVNKAGTNTINATSSVSAGYAAVSVYLG